MSVKKILDKIELNESKIMKKGGNEKKKDGRVIQLY